MIRALFSCLSQPLSELDLGEIYSQKQEHGVSVAWCTSTLQRALRFRVSDLQLAQKSHRSSRNACSIDNSDRPSQAWPAWVSDFRTSP